MSISWIKSDKRLENSYIDNIYYPESINELETLCLDFYKSKTSFVVLGYCTNSLLLPSYNPHNIVCITKVNKIEDNGEFLSVDCGVLSNRLSKYCTEKGYNGFEGLVDLPGCVSSAIIGNAGCFGSLMTDKLSHFDFLTPLGVKTIYKEDLHLCHRSSDIKRGLLEGVLLKAYFVKEVQDTKLLLQKSQEAHEDRKRTQPSAANNLGTTLAGCRKTTKYGKIIRGVSRRLYKIIPGATETGVILFLTGNSCLKPYLFDLGRYMFLDQKSHSLFNRYWSLIKRLYQDPGLEIIIYE